MVLSLFSSQVTAAMNDDARTGRREFVQELRLRNRMRSVYGELHGTGMLLGFFLLSRRMEA